MTVMLHSVIKITKNSRFLQCYLNFRAKNQNLGAKTQKLLNVYMQVKHFWRFSKHCALISVILE